jgi:hypothetical protein
MDALGTIRANVDVTRCLAVGPRSDSDGIVEGRIDSCDSSRFMMSFRYMGENESYCLTGYDASIQGQLAGKPCESAGGLMKGSLDNSFRTH